MPVSAAAAEGVSGAVGSVLALVSTYPLKTIYTYQALAEKSTDGTAAAAMSILDVIQKYKLSGLYVGMEPNMIESAASSGVYFYLYSKLRHLVVAHQAKKRQQDGAQGGDTRSSSIGVLASLLVATLAGAGNQLVTLPFSVIATRMQAQQKVKRDLADKNRNADAAAVVTSFPGVANLVMSEAGLGGFWKGLLPSMILLANPAVQYMLYEQILGLLRTWKQRKADAAAKEGEEVKPVKLSPLEVFMASALAKIGATFATYPLIVVKSRLQASGKAAGGGSVSTKDVMVRTWQSEGIAGFYSGLQAKLLQTALNAALMLMLKEQLHGAVVSVLEKGFCSSVAAYWDKMLTQVLVSL